jgi:hypothetical protein
MKHISIKTETCCSMDVCASSCRFLSSGRCTLFDQHIDGWMYGKYVRCDKCKELINKEQSLEVRISLVDDWRL